MPSSPGRHLNRWPQTSNATRPRTIEGIDPGRIAKNKEQMKKRLLKDEGPLADDLAWCTSLVMEIHGNGRARCTAHVVKVFSDISRKSRADRRRKKNNDRGELALLGAHLVGHHGIAFRVAPRGAHLFQRKTNPIPSPSTPAFSKACDTRRGTRPCPNGRNKRDMPRWPKGHLQQMAQKPSAIYSKWPRRHPPSQQMALGPSAIHSAPIRP